ncbi:hypothetical protein Tco_0970690 [Tanacetum coccineum]
MNTRTRQERKVPCSKDYEAEDGAHPCTPTTVRKAQGIRKVTLKAKIVREGTGSLNHDEKSPVPKMTISPNLGWRPNKKEEPLGLETPEGVYAEFFVQKRIGIRAQHKQEKRPDRFTLLTKTPKEILALEKGNFKTPLQYNSIEESKTANNLRSEAVAIIRRTEAKPACGRPAEKERAKESKGPATTLINRFSRENKWPLGQITLLVKIGDDEHSTSTWMDFMVIAKHRLNVRKGCQPVRQKKRGQAVERNVAINDEVSKLMTAGIMREVHYHDWLSNPVMVKKSDNSWGICVDFKDLNKACPKDGSNPCADSPSNASWTHTRGITKYKWQRKMRKRPRSL